MALSVIITGTSGMVGKGVLLECLDHPEIEKVLVINRRSIHHNHPKLHELIVKDFTKIAEFKEELSGYSACYFCGGVSVVGLSEQEYTQITYDVTLSVANVVLEQNPESIFTYVSGAGTDSTEKGRSMWARVKGKTENDLLALGFKKAYMFRPGYIQPLRGIKSKTGWYQTLYNIFRPLYAILKHFPSTATNTSNVGLAMINVTKQLPELKHLENKDINYYATAK